MLGLLLKQYLNKGKTGQLLIKFKEEDHLCKIFIEDGKAVYIMMANKSPYEIIDYIIDKEIEDSDFLEKVRPPKRLDESFNEKLLKIANIQENKETLDISDESLKGDVSYEKVESLVDSFIDIVGPIGTVVTEKYFKNIGYFPGSDIDAQNFLSFFNWLIEKLPKEKQEIFQNKFYEIIKKGG